MARCQPVLSLDMCWLKGTQWAKNQLAVAGCLDGENRDCLVGLAMSPVESAANYEYMVDNMKKDPEAKTFLEQPGETVRSTNYSY